jgi:hypothetical protein
MRIRVNEEIIAVIFILPSPHKAFAVIATPRFGVQTLDTSSPAVRHRNTSPVLKVEPFWQIDVLFWIEKVELVMPRPKKFILKLKRGRHFQSNALSPTVVNRNDFKTRMEVTK